MKHLTCIVCPKGCRLEIDDENGFTVSGNGCIRGEKYGKEEITCPKRTVTSTVKIKNALHKRLPVKTKGEVKKEDVFAVMEIIRKTEVKAPVKRGDVIVFDIAKTGVDLVAAKTFEKIER